MTQDEKINRLKDIPGMMRQVADRIAMGEYGKHIQAGFVTRNLDTEEVEVFGWGENSADIDTLLEMGREKIMEIDQSCQEYNDGGD